MLQSTVRYPQIAEWIDKFLKPMMNRAARSLRSKGYLALNIEGPFMYKLLKNSASDPELFDIARSSLETPLRMEYMGIIGYRSDMPRDLITHPIFVWRRM